MKDLLPPNAEALERGLADAAARISDVPVALRGLWSSADCHEDLLAWLAWSLGVEEWDPAWETPVKRAVIASAFEVHREKGTLAALRRILETLGAEFDYVERPEGAAMTAKLIVYNSNAVLVGDLPATVKRVKRAALKMEFELHSALIGTVDIAAGFGAACVVEIDLEGYAV